METIFPTQNLIDFMCRKELAFGDEFLIKEEPTKKGDSWVTEVVLSTGEVESIYLGTSDIPSENYIVIRGHQNGASMFNYFAVSLKHLIETSNAIEKHISDQLASIS